MNTEKVLVEAPVKKPSTKKQDDAAIKKGKAIFPDLVEKMDENYFTGGSGQGTVGDTQAKLYELYNKGYYTYEADIPYQWQFDLYLSDNVWIELREWDVYYRSVILRHHFTPLLSWSRP